MSQYYVLRLKFELVDPILILHPAPHANISPSKRIPRRLFGVHNVSTHLLMSTEVDVLLFQRRVNPFRSMPKSILIVKIDSDVVESEIGRVSERLERR